MTAQVATCRHCLHPIRRAPTDALWTDPDGWMGCGTGAHDPIPRTIRDEP